MDGSKRLLLHGRVIPILPGDFARTPSLLKTWNISAWNTYTQFDQGWWLDDEKSGVPFLETARSLGLPLVCVHKGLPLMGKELLFSRCDDVGRAARKFKDITLIIYHSGYDDTISEGPFVLGSGKGGVDSLVQSLIDNGTSQIPTFTLSWAQPGAR